MRFTELKQRINERIRFYQRWVNGNLGKQPMPTEISQSKTGIGEPIARMANCFRASGVIATDVPVLIRVDQIEELHRAHTQRQQRVLLSFRKMLNRAFSARDARINYRMGARRYGWETLGSVLLKSLENS